MVSLPRTHSLPPTKRTLRQSKLKDAQQKTLASLLQNVKGKIQSKAEDCPGRREALTGDRALTGPTKEKTAVQDVTGPDEIRIYAVDYRLVTYPC